MYADRVAIHIPDSAAREPLYQSIDRIRSTRLDSSDSTSPTTFLNASATRGTSYTDITISLGEDLMHRAGFLFACLFVAASSEAAQIYLCKTHQGAEYWAQSWCSTSGGYTVDAVTVPDGMPFKEQTRVAEKFRAKKHAAQAQEDKVRDKAGACRAIDDELADIWKRYDKGQFNEAAMIGKDQARTRELKRERSQLRCEAR